MDRVLKGGPWSFDNQVLLLTRWNVGMTAGNVRFDSVALWVQIWGTPFDLVSPRIAETVGSRLGSVVEIEKKQKFEGHSYFMRVKVDIPIVKPIRRGAFLAGSDGKNHWVTFKYERLPLFCHFCGLLGHDLRHCAHYFAATKNDRETTIEESNENPRITDGVDTENLGTVTDSMQADAELDVNQANVEDHNSGPVFSKPNIQPLLNGMPDLNRLTAKEVNSDNRDAVQVESRSEVLSEQGPHKNHPSMDGAGLSNLKPKSTWTRFNRMEFGFGGLARAITLPTLGKRDMRDDGAPDLYSLLLILPFEIKSWLATSLIEVHNTKSVDHRSNGNNPLGQP
ncbi:hypothetical protein SO802_030202 [Lithocarpus litseifolius]|uniref:Zinc knuckle CX2CX4HX4C domain-containing protein n=1 Tax=Lithocarpus litseifolius TaxID=425828 RepID=A0AAW2BH33_9ROSI